MRSSRSRALIFLMMATAAGPPSAIMMKVLSGLGRTAQLDGRATPARGRNRVASPARPDAVVALCAVGSGGKPRPHPGHLPPGRPPRDHDDRAYADSPAASSPPPVTTHLRC